MQLVTGGGGVFVDGADAMVEGGELQLVHHDQHTGRKDAGRRGVHPEVEAAAVVAAGPEWGVSIRKIAVSGRVRRKLGRG